MIETNWKINSLKKTVKYSSGRLFSHRFQHVLLFGCVVRSHDDCFRQRRWTAEKRVRRPECSVGGIKLRIIESKAKGNSPFLYLGSVMREPGCRAWWKASVSRTQAAFSPTHECMQPPHFCMRGWQLPLGRFHLSMPQSMNMEFRGLLFALRREPRANMCTCGHCFINLCALSALKARAHTAWPRFAVNFTTLSPSPSKGHSRRWNCPSLQISSHHYRSSWPNRFWGKVEIILCVVGNMIVKLLFKLSF